MANASAYYASIVPETHTMGTEINSLSIMANLVGCCSPRNFRLGIGSGASNEELRDKGVFSEILSHNLSLMDAPHGDDSPGTIAIIGLGQ